MGLPLKYFKDHRSMPIDFQRIVYPKAYFSQICGLDFFQGRLLRREPFFLDPRTPHKMESVEKASHRTHKSCQTLTGRCLSHLPCLPGIFCYRAFPPGLIDCRLFGRKMGIEYATYNSAIAILRNQQEGTRGQEGIA